MRRYTINYLIFKNHFTLVRLDEAGDYTQGGRLAAARGTEQSYKLLIADIQIEIFEHLIIPECDGDVFQINNNVFFNYAAPLCRDTGELLI